MIDWVFFFLILAESILLLHQNNHDEMEATQYNGNDLGDQKNLDLRIRSPISCVSLGKSLNFSELSFLHVQNEDNQSYLIG